MSHQYLNANLDLIAGINYNFTLVNAKHLGMHIRYYYGVSTVNPPFNFAGKRNRIGIGLSYEIFRN